MPPNRPRKSAGGRTTPKAEKLLELPNQNTTVAVGYIHGSVGTGCFEFMRCMLKMFVRDAYVYPGRIIGPIEFVSSANVSNARCRVVKMFLATGAEWLLFIDSDMTFAEDLLDHLLLVADPVERPIVGGLAFVVAPTEGANGVAIINRVQASPLTLKPTIYTQDVDKETTIRWDEWPADSAFAVDSTGAAVMLIHRSVLADPRWLEDGHPLPWFRESVRWGDVCSEDHFFCLRAAEFGYKTIITPMAETGHVKTFVADNSLYQFQQELIAAYKAQAEQAS